MPWEPGNPKGWGDPVPLVMLILLLVLMGSVVDNVRSTTFTEQQCREILGIPRQ